MRLIVAYKSLLEISVKMLALIVIISNFMIKIDKIES